MKEVLVLDFLDKILAYKILFIVNSLLGWSINL